MQLTTKNLSNYLPYGLKMIFPKSGKIITIQSLLGVSKGRPTIICQEDGNLWDIESGIFLPILRPLSDLTNQIHHNGEKFIPILTLMDISLETKWSNTEYCSTNYGVGEWWAKFKDNDPNAYFGYNKSGYFYSMFRDEHKIVHNQRLLFQKLSEWMFDIDGLLEHEAAVDVTTLSENPYK